MDAKDLRIESGLGDRNDGSKYSHGEVALQCNRNKTYRDIGCNPLAKAEGLVPAHVRPCAVIEPDRVAPPPASHDAYIKKPSVDPWRSCPDSLYPRPSEYTLKPQSTVSPSRNISPRQTYQENMSRILVPPTYSVKIADEPNINHVQDRNAFLSKNSKQTMVPEAKYCDVPYAVNLLPNEHKTIATEMCAPSVNSPAARAGPNVWPTSGVNLHTPRAYGAHDIYQYPQYPSCAGPRPPVIPMARPPRTYQEEAGFSYPDSYYQDASVRFKPYPSVKERYSQARYDYISNYPNPFHPPPYATHKFDIQNTRPSLPYPVYPHLKYLESRVPEHSMDGYQRPNQQPPLNYNTQFRNQVIHPTYAPPLGNAQNRVPFPTDALVKSTSKPTYDNNKAYVEFENSKTKYPDSYFLNELARVHQVQKSNCIPNYASSNLHPIPMQYHRKDNIAMKAYEYNIPNYRPFEHQPQFSPSTLAISPTDSITSNDAIQAQTNTQEDCGYASQSSTTSVRSIDSLNRLSNEYYRRYDYRYRQITGNSHLIYKPESTPKENTDINVRQFWSMWNEGEEEQTSTNSPKGTTVPKPVDNNHYNINCDGSVGQQTTKMRDQLYVLGQVNVPNEELAKYEHIQKVSKLPENIKGYNSIELLNQFEEVIESSRRNNFTHSNNEFTQSIKDRKNTVKQIVEVLPRPVSPLDVESKISQSIIHKDVGCNFEIKPCSPKMLNVEIAAPVQNILGERSIEKVSNQLTYKAKSPLSMRFDSNKGCNKIQRQRSTTPYENSSCKMDGSPFVSNNMESMKTNYSLQDLETSSGVCLASLPRLDNEIELNFPEVNQQFINANKHTSAPQNKQDIYSNEVSKHNVELNLSDSDGRNGSRNCSLLPVNVETITETKIPSNKSKNDHSDNSDKKSNANASRTDSVIIKNPENVRRVEENKEKHASYKPIEVEPTPLNLTAQCVSHVKESDTPINERKHRASECALDYSLSKNEHDFYVYNEDQIKTTQNYQCMPDMSANSCLLSDDHLKADNVEEQVNISKLSSESDLISPITKNIIKNISYAPSDCGSKVKDGTKFLDEKNVSLETHKRSVNVGQSETTSDKIIDEKKHNLVKDNKTMKQKLKHKNKHKTSKVNNISSNRLNRLKEVIQNKSVDGNANLNIISIVEDTNESRIGITNVISTHVNNKTAENYTASSITDREEVVNFESNKARKCYADLVSESNLFVQNTNVIKHSPNDSSAHQHSTSALMKNYIDSTDVKNLLCIKQINEHNLKDSGHILEHASPFPKSEAECQNNKGLDSQSELSDILKCSNDGEIVINHVAQCDAKETEGNYCKGLNNTNNSLVDETGNLEKRVIIDKISNHADVVIHQTMEDINKKYSIDSGYKSNKNSYAELEEEILENCVHINEDSVFMDQDSNSKLKNTSEKVNKNKEQQSFSDTCVSKIKEKFHKKTSENSQLINNKEQNTTSMQPMNEIDSIDANMRILFEDTDENLPDNILNNSKIVDDTQRDFDLSQKMEINLNIDSVINESEQGETNDNDIEISTILMESSESLDLKTQEIKLIEEANHNILLTTEISMVNKACAESLVEDKKGTSVLDTAEIVDRAYPFNEESSLKVSTNKAKGASILNTADNFVMEQIGVKKLTEETSLNVLTDTAKGFNADKTDVKESAKEKKSKVLIKEVRDVLKSDQKMYVDETDANELIDETILKPLPEDKKNNIFLKTMEDVNADDTDLNKLIVEKSLEAFTEAESKKDTIGLNTTTDFSVDKTDVTDLIEKTISKALTGDESGTNYQNTTANYFVDETAANVLFKETDLKVLAKHEKDAIVTDTKANINIDKTGANELIGETISKALTSNERHTIVRHTAADFSIDETNANALIIQISSEALTQFKKEIVVEDTTVNISVDDVNAKKYIEKTISKDIVDQDVTANINLNETDTNALIKENPKGNIVTDTKANISVDEINANELVGETISKALTSDERGTIVLDTAVNVIDETDGNAIVIETSSKTVTKCVNDNIAKKTIVNISVSETDAKKTIEKTISKALTGGDSYTTDQDNTANFVVDETGPRILINQTNLKAFSKDEIDNLVINTITNINVDETETNELIEETIAKALTGNENDTTIEDTTTNLGVYKSDTDESIKESILKVITKDERNTIAIETTANLSASNESLQEMSLKTLMEVEIEGVVPVATKNDQNELVKKECDSVVQHNFKKYVDETFTKVLINNEKCNNAKPVLKLSHLDETPSKLTETNESADTCMPEIIANEKSKKYIYNNDGRSTIKSKFMQLDEYSSNFNLTKEKNITETLAIKNIDSKSVSNVQPSLNPATHYCYRSKKLNSPLFQNLMLNNEGKVFNNTSSAQNIKNCENDNLTIAKETTPGNNTINAVIFETKCTKSCASVSICGNTSNSNSFNDILLENTACENKLSDYIHNSQELVDIEHCNVYSNLLNSTVEIEARKHNNYKAVLETADTVECTVQNDLVQSQGISFKYPNNSVISQITEKIFCADENDTDDIKLNKANNGSSINRRQSLKRSYSDSALNTIVSRDDHKENIRNLHYSWLAKRNKCEFESITSNNRRNSINVGENISFCILIDDNCIITEESEDKICIAELEEDYSTEINLENDACSFEEFNTSAHETNVDIVGNIMPECDDVTSIREAWVENVACVDTVFSDEVAENVVISALSSPTNSTSEYDHIDPENYDRSTSSHTDKVKLMLGEKMSVDDALIVDTLYRTPHMNIMNKTLLYGEKNVETDDDLTDDSSDDVDQDRILIEPCEWKPSLIRTPDYIDPAHTLNDFRLETPENKENVFVKDLSPLRKIDDYLDVSSAENETDEHTTLQNVSKTSKTIQSDTGASFKSSLDNVNENKEKKYTNPYTLSSSPEVSSTTSEDKNSSILLKITNLNGSRVSEINEIKTITRPRCKFTEKKEYSTSNYRFPNRPLLTKAAQKYIPPIKETIRDLKVKISLPQHSLLKFKQLKLSRNEPKTNKQSNVIPRIAKKLKPNFDDVLKSIDDMQRKKHTEKNKKAKSVIPKVVIKKNVNGSHYASTTNNDTFNPDLTGRRWQPWVFLEKSIFIDKMAIKNKTRAIYNHRKRTYVLKENFKKYKSASNTKFVISQPKTPGQLKYTIRLKHTY